MIDKDFEILMMENQSYAKIEYEKCLKSGMFFEFFPLLSARTIFGGCSFIQYLNKKVESGI